MSIVISDLIASAETIRTNNLPDSNTPELVGSTMKNALLLLQDLQSAKDGPYYIDVSISDAQNLPSSPTDQQKLTAYLIGSYVYVWNGTAWTPKQFVGPVGEKGDKGDSGVTDAASVVAISDYTAGDGSDATKVYVGTANALKNLYLYVSGMIAKNTQNIGTNDYPSYDASLPYKVGDIRTYDGNLYRCTTNITTSEAWNSAHWTQTSMNEIQRKMNSVLNISETYPTSGTNGGNTYSLTGSKEVDRLTLTSGVATDGIIKITLNSTEHDIAVMAAKAEVDRLTFTGGVTANGTIKIHLGGVEFDIAVTTDYNTADLLAAFIATQTFTGWTVTYIAGNTYIDFTCNTAGTAPAPTYDINSSGATGSITQITVGEDNQSTIALLAIYIATQTIEGFTLTAGSDYVDFISNSDGDLTTPSYDDNGTGAIGGICVNTVFSISALSVIPIYLQRGGLFIIYIDRKSGLYKHAYLDNPTFTEDASYWNSKGESISYPFHIMGALEFDGEIHQIHTTFYTTDFIYLPKGSIIYSEQKGIYNSYYPHIAVYNEDFSFKEAPTYSGSSPFYYALQDCYVKYTNDIAGYINPTILYQYNKNFGYDGFIWDGTIIHGFLNGLGLISTDETRYVTDYIKLSKGDRVKVLEKNLVIGNIYQPNLCIYKSKTLSSFFSSVQAEEEVGLTYIAKNDCYVRYTNALSYKNTIKIERIQNNSLSESDILQEIVVIS